MDVQFVWQENPVYRNEQLVGWNKCFLWQCAHDVWLIEHGKGEIFAMHQCPSKCPAPSEADALRELTTIRATEELVVDCMMDFGVSRDDAWELAATELAFEPNHEEKTTMDEKNTAKVIDINDARITRTQKAKDAISKAANAAYDYCPTAKQALVGIGSVALLGAAAVVGWFGKDYFTKGDGDGRGQV